MTRNSVDVGHVIGGPGQRTSDRAGGYDAEVRQPRVLTWDRMKRRAAEALFLLLVVPLFVGPWALVVYIPLLTERGILALAGWLNIEVDVDRVSMLCLSLLTFAVVALAPDALLSWWPFPGQQSRASWRGLLWPARWPGAIPLIILLRVVPVVAALRAWREVWYLDQRQRQETITPTISSVAYEQANPGSVEIPGVYNPHRPAEPQRVTINQIKPVPFRSQGNAQLVYDMLQAPSGGQVGKDKVLAMLEAQDAGRGFSWRTWRREGWTRSEWNAAMEILTDMGIITPPVSGQTTRLMRPEDDVLAEVERLA